MASKDQPKNSSSKGSPGTNEKVELSDEDIQLKEELFSYVKVLSGDNQELYMPALNALATQIKASTSSMTSVPKPLKFMRPHYNTMKNIHTKITEAEVKRAVADIISVLAMTMGEPRECLKYRLLSKLDGIGEWGHEYVRHLSGEIATEFTDYDLYTSNSKLRDVVMKLVEQIIPFDMEHNGEAEACDLLMEIECLDLLEKYVDDSNYQRVCTDLVSCVPYVTEPEKNTLLRNALKLYRQFKQYPHALRLAIQLNDLDLIKEIFIECPSRSVQKQLAFMLGRQQIYLDISDSTHEIDDFNDIMSNCHLNNHFLNLANELDIADPKTPEDVYKSHLENIRPQFGANQVDSARQNLAASFVNGFVNAAFGRDKLLMEDGNKWLYKNKEHGMMSATASLGLVLLWDVDGGLMPIDKYLYSSEDYIKAGALLACGVVNCGVRNECDPALALLSDYIQNSSSIMRIGAILGLGLAYVGSNRESVIRMLVPIFSDAKSSMEIIGMAALACGLISVGSGSATVSMAIVQTLLEKTEAELKDTYARYLSLGLGLCYLGKQTCSETVIAALEVMPEPFKSMATVMVDICAYAGTGNVLKVQQMLHICSEHFDTDKDDSKTDKKEKSNKDREDRDRDMAAKQAIAVIGIALISMGEDNGTEMAFRMFGHLLRYCEPVIRRAVPLALGLISVSNPNLNILDTLSKFSHDSDAEVAHNAIFGMGLVGAGTNNARLAAMLRQLAQYHAKDPNNLFMVRIAQGLTHLGKGTLTLSPFHCDRQLMSPVAVAGLMATLIGFLDVKNIILGRSHYLLYTLAASMQPKMLVTFDEELNSINIPVRVGLAVDVVGQAGKPKTITGFQTHTTPVLLAHGERAELATDEYIALTPIIEGFVILKKNPNLAAAVAS